MFRLTNHGGHREHGERRALLFPPCSPWLVQAEHPSRNRCKQPKRVKLDIAPVLVIAPTATSAFARTLEARRNQVASFPYVVKSGCVNCVSLQFASRRQQHALQRFQPVARFADLPLHLRQQIHEQIHTHRIGVFDTQFQAVQFR